MPKPRWWALRSFDLGGYGTETTEGGDPVDVVRHFDEGDVVPGVESHATALGLVVSGYVRPANAVAEDLLEEWRSAERSAITEAGG